jgi:cytochrome P450
MELKDSIALQWIIDAVKGLKWYEIGGITAGAVIAKLMLNQYGVLRYRNLPEHDLGLPIIGHTRTVFKESLEVWGYNLSKGKKVLITNFLFSNVCLVKYSVYQKYLHKEELEGKLCPGYFPTFKAIAGPNSILLLPGGKGHQKHKKLRSKLLGCLGPKPMLQMIPDVLSIIRETLDQLVVESSKNGFAVFNPAASHIASKGSIMMVTAGLDADLQTQVETLCDVVVKGLFSVPINLGRFNAFGRAVAARKQVTNIIKDIMKMPSLAQKNILADLVAATEHGEAFSFDEIIDTVFTLLVAGKLTTSEALPTLLVSLHNYPDWAKKVASEGLDFKSSIEEDSATMRVVRECLRINPPAGAYRRQSIDPSSSIDLHEHGKVPPGCPIAVYFLADLKDMGEDFNPDRWTPDVVRDQFLSFGGNQPHACIGKTLALLELQLFARVLTSEYDFEALDTKQIPNPSNPVALAYENGLRIKIKRKVS